MSIYERKAYILFGLDKKAKLENLKKVDTDSFLFSENLSEKIKSTKALEKVSLKIKSQVLSNNNPSVKRQNALNWKILPSRSQRPAQRELPKKRLQIQRASKRQTTPRVICRDNGKTVHRRLKRRIRRQKHIVSIIRGKRRPT